MPFLKLPIELVLQVVSELDTPIEVLNLATTCKPLYNILGERAILEKDATYQKLRAGDYVYFTGPYFFEKSGCINVRLSPFGAPMEPILHWAIMNNASVDFIDKASAVLQSSFPESLNGGWHPIYPAPLLAAITANRFDIVELFLGKGCNAGGVTRCCKYTGKIVEQCSTIFACQAEDTAIASLLLDAGAEPTLPKGLFEAVECDMPVIVKTILAKFYTNKNSPEYQNHLDRAFWRAGACDASGEVIDILLSEDPRLRGEQGLYDVLCDAIRNESFRATFHLWDIYVRHHMKPGVQIGEFLEFVVKYDECLPITKQICHEFPWVTLAGRNDNRWSAFENGREWARSEYYCRDYNLNGASLLENQALLVWAIWSPLKDPIQSRLRNRNHGTIRYLFDAGYKLSLAHLEAAVHQNNLEVIEIFIAQDPSFLELSTGKSEWRRGYVGGKSQYGRLVRPDWRVVDKALLLGDWVTAFKLIYLGARCDCIPQEVRAHLQYDAADAFSAQRKHPKSKSRRGRLHFLTTMKSIRPQPDKTVFSTLAKCRRTREFKIQLYTLFQLTLGVDFTDNFPYENASAASVLSCPLKYCPRHSKFRIGWEYSESEYYNSED